MRILVVDDQRSARMVLGKILSTLAGVEIVEAADEEGARRLLDEQEIDIAFVDLRLSSAPGDRSGHAVIRHVRENTNAAPIVVTAFAEMVEVREAMRAGARDYLLKDELCEELVLPLVTRICDERALRAEVVTLRARQTGTSGTLGMVGDSPAMERLRDAIRRVAASTRPVLVTGPSGAGKELAVRAIHRLGSRPEAPLVDLNCAALPEQLIEAQLFGHLRGAFTGAERDHPGFLASVGEGTLFLDEVAELPAALQAKLLRVLETRTFRPVGAVDTRPFAGRIIAATHRDLAEEVRQNRFRQDLHFRLDVLHVRVPALAERASDVPAIIASFLDAESRPLRFAPDAVESLKGRPWPGNVRELRNLIDRLVVFSDDDPVTAETIEAFGATGAPEGDGPLLELARSVLSGSAEDKLAAARDVLVDEALRLADGNKTRAARLLGVHRKVVERVVSRRD